MSTVEQNSRVSTEIERRRDEQSPPPPVSATKLYVLCGASAFAAFLLTLGASYSRIDWALVQAIPATVWGALLIAGLALTGVVVTNRSHDRRASKQLDHDQSKFELQLFHDADKLDIQLERAAEEERVKRETEMRREVYLDAAEQLVNAQIGLATLYTLDLEAEGAMAPLKGYAVASAKLMVVADAATSREAMKLQNLYAMALLRAIPEAGLTRDANTAAEYSKKTAEHYTQEWTRLVNEIELIYPAGDASNLPRLTAVHDKFVEWRDAASKVYRERRDLSNLAKVAYASFLRPHLEEIAQQQITVLSRLREELGLDGAEEEAQAAAKKTRDQIYAFIDETYIRRELPNDQSRDAS